MTDTPAKKTRPKRTVSKPTRNPTAITTATPTPSRSTTKRKARVSETDSKNPLETLLTSEYSKLTTMDISDILNYENFINLSGESQELLCSLLPPNAFSTFTLTIDPTHASRKAKGQSDSMDVDIPIERAPATLDPMTFSSSFFQSAALTFQDHLVSSWLSPDMKEKLEEFNRRTQDGSLHAEWKDEAWNRELQPSEHLVLLVRREFLKEGDVISYRRTFIKPEITVEKDLLVQFIDPKSHAITLLLQPNIIRTLPTTLLVIGHPPPEPPTLTMDDIMGTCELEDGILDVDGRVSRADRHLAASQTTTSAGADQVALSYTNMDVISARSSARAAKSFTIWRWREEMMHDIEMQMLQERGGRELVGTVYYLRNM
ncbi:hypothetical protein C8Q75DRAFT_715542 [Abortiporus biennis]|nr:hypothetical protein C8Q75DRAFT_715542 [Abortiporus biennis]